jgi:hypothetical protein
MPVNSGRQDMARRAADDNFAPNDDITALQNAVVVPANQERRDIKAAL